MSTKGLFKVQTSKKPSEISGAIFTGQRPPTLKQNSETSCQSQETSVYLEVLDGAGPDVFQCPTEAPTSQSAIIACQSSVYRQLSSTRDKLILQFLVCGAFYSYWRLVAGPRRRVAAQPCHLVLSTGTCTGPSRSPHHRLNGYRTAVDDMCHLFVRGHVVLISTDPLSNANWQLACTSHDLLQWRLLASSLAKLNSFSFSVFYSRAAQLSAHKTRRQSYVDRL